MKQQLVLCSLLLLAGSALASAPVYIPKVKTSYPHDPQSYTQGLLWHGGKLYESTGLYGRSTVSIRQLKSGRVQTSTALPKELFGEGLALVGNELIQLTWKENRVQVYDKNTLQLKRSLPYPWEGWGLTYDGQYLIASDGSEVLRFLDPKTLRLVRSIAVQEDGQPISWLNELEYIQGEIYANVYGADRIARIDPKTGEVIAWLDLSQVYPAAKRVSSETVLNGIAYDPRRRMLLVTGKYWPRLYLIPFPKPTKKPG